MRRPRKTSHLCASISASVTRSSSSISTASQRAITSTCSQRTISRNCWSTRAASAARTSCASHTGLNLETGLKKKYFRSGAKTMLKTRTARLSDANSLSHTSTLILRRLAADFNFSLTYSGDINGLQASIEIERDFDSERDQWQKIKTLNFSHSI